MSTAAIDAQMRSRAFARVIGPFLTVVTAVYAVRLPALMPVADDLFAQPFLALMLGVLMLGMGLVIIGLHRSWRGPLAVTISLFGWFVAIRGALLFATPDLIESGAKATTLSPTGMTIARILFGVLAVIGVLLAYVGWFTEPRARHDQTSA